MNSILILGNGFVGSNLYNYFSKIYPTTIFDKTKINVLDISKNLFTEYDTIIYCVGIKNIIECEQNTNLAFCTNGLGVQNIIKYLNSKQKFIYLSSDYVFSGKYGNYSETDLVDPKTIYGYTKVLGELFAKNHTNHINIRTSGIYGKKCKWLDDLLAKLDNNLNIDCYSDIFNSPTYIINLAEMIHDLISIDFIGTINLCGSDKVNRFDLYSTVATIFGKPKDLLKISKCSNNLYFPKNISLNHALYTNITNKIPNSINTGLARLKNDN